MQNGVHSKNENVKVAHREISALHSDEEAVQQRLQIPKKTRARRNSAGSVSLQEPPKPHKSSGKKRSHSHHHHHRHRRSKSADVRQPIVVGRKATQADDVTKAIKSVMEERYNYSIHATASQTAISEKTPLKKKPSLPCCNGNCCWCCPIF